MNLLTVDVVVKFVRAEFRNLEKWQDVSPELPEPAVLRTNGDHSWIQRVKQVEKAPLMNLLTVVLMCQQVVKFVGAEFRKSERYQDAVPNRAATSNLEIKWRIPLDLALFYSPFLNDCADLLVVRNVCYG